MPVLTIFTLSLQIIVGIYFVYTIAGTERVHTDPHKKDREAVQQLFGHKYRKCIYINYIWQYTHSTFTTM